MRKFIAFAIFVIFAPKVVFAEVNVLIDNLPVEFEGAKPTIIDGRVFVPVRGMFEKLGFEVDWNAETQTVTMQADDSRTITIIVGRNEFTINGKTFCLDVPAQILDDRAMLPIRNVLESIGLNVGWNAETSTILVGILPHENVAPNCLINRFLDGLIAWDYDRIALPVSAELAEFDFENELFSQTGSLQSYKVTDSQHVNGITFYEVSATHTTADATYTIVASDGVVTGVLPHSFCFRAKPHSEDAPFFATEVQIGVGLGWQLDGILTMPRHASTESPVPAVLLVHGTGARNMDASVFNNRPFRDIADYLSAQGIAVLRYNKRTFEHSMRFSQVFGDTATVRDEVIEDALWAAEMLRADKRVSKVFVLGHSLGGSLAPQIAEEAGLDGAIMLAASPRRLYEVQYDQNIRGINTALKDGSLSHTDAFAYFERVEELFNTPEWLPHLTRAELANTRVFGIPAVYHLSLIDSLPLPVIQNNSRPVLILQGGRDFKVFADTDFRIFEVHAENLPHVKTVLYDDLNHLFMPSKTNHNDPRDYIPKSTVDIRALQDITEWIKIMPFAPNE